MKNKLNFKVYVDGRSEKIQKHLFALGCKWASGDTDIKLTERPFLLVTDKTIMGSDDMNRFKNYDLPELTVAEVLALEPEPVKQPEPQLNPFDRVLARDKNDEWSVDFYSHYDNRNTTHVCIGTEWEQCTPYEGNEHLFGTTNSPK